MRYFENNYTHGYDANHLSFLTTNIIYTKSMLVINFSIIITIIIFGFGV
jgi:hypothetical protein